MTQSTPPGWYPDGEGGQRWWDGNQWTEHILPPETSDRPAPTPAEQPVQPGPSDVTRVRPPVDAAPAVPAAPEAGQPPTALPTQVAGPGAGLPGQPEYFAQPGQPGQPAWQAQPYAGASSGGGISGKIIALIAGGAAVLIALVIVVVLVLGGGGSPQSVVEDFIDADSCSDAEKLVTDDFQEEFGECSEDQLGGFGDDGDFDVEIKDEEIDGDEATVEVETSGEIAGEELSQTITFSLVKDDGDWKIDGIG